MPTCQLKLVEGTIVGDFVNNRATQGSLQQLSQLVDTATVYGTGTAAISLSAGHMFGLLNTVNQFHSQKRSPRQSLYRGLDVRSGRTDQNFCE
jgi:hypothetical protein